MNETMDTIRWWEKRRIFFTIIVLLFELLTLFLVKGNLKQFSYKTVWMNSLTFPILANIMYTSSWVLEIVVAHYLHFQVSNFQRKGLFVLGILFSIVLTVANFLLVFRVN